MLHGNSSNGLHWGWEQLYWHIYEGLASRDGGMVQVEVEESFSQLQMNKKEMVQQGRREEHVVKYGGDDG